MLHVAMPSETFWYLRREKHSTRSDQYPVSSRSQKLMPMEKHKPIVLQNFLPDCNTLQLRDFLSLKSCFVSNSMNFFSAKLYRQHLNSSKALALAISDISVWKQGIPWVDCMFYDERLSLVCFKSLTCCFIWSTWLLHRDSEQSFPNISIFT